MKIFHTENNREVIYVQMQDLAYLYNETAISVPQSIVNQVFSGVTLINDSNRFDFIRFEKESEVSFFKNINFIINYNDYKNLTDDQLQERYEEFVNEYNKLVKKWNNMSIKKRKNDHNTICSLQNIKYIIDFIQEIYNFKYEGKSMPFPDFINN